MARERVVLTYQGRPVGETELVGGRLAEPVLADLAESNGHSAHEVHEILERLLVEAEPQDREEHFGRYVYGIQRIVDCPACGGCGDLAFPDFHASDGVRNERCGMCGGRGEVQEVVAEAYP